MQPIDNLPIYSNGDNEQQTTCPQCGSRTLFLGNVGVLEHHQCPECGYEFLLDLEDDAPIDESDPLP